MKNSFQNDAAQAANVMNGLAKIVSNHYVQLWETQLKSAGELIDRGFSYSEQAGKIRTGDDATQLYHEAREKETRAVSDYMLQCQKIADETGRATRDAARNCGEICMRTAQSVASQASRPGVFPATENFALNGAMENGVKNANAIFDGFSAFTEKVFDNFSHLADNVKDVAQKQVAQVAQNATPQNGKARAGRR